MHAFASKYILCNTAKATALAQQISYLDRFDAIDFAI